MDSRQLLPGEFTEMFEVIKDATHEEMGGLTVHTGTHPLMGQIVIVTNTEQEAVLIHE
jgi:hypothetical protein